MRYIILSLFLIACSSSTEQNSRTAPKATNLPYKSTQTKPLPKTNPNPQVLIEKLKKYINHYKNEVNSYQEYLDMKKELHILNDSINKLSYGSGLDIEIIFKLEYLLYNQGVCNSLYPLILSDSISFELSKELLPKMIAIFTKQGDFEKSIILDSIYVLRNNEYSTPYFKETMTQIKLIKRSLDSLNAASLNPDQLLWEKGVLLFENFRTGWNESEVGWDMSLSFSYLNKLIKDHPKSNYTDNAVLAMLKYEEGMSHEGGDQSYNLMAVNKYREFLSNYPETEEKAWINLRIVQLLYSAEVQREQRLNTILASRDQLDFVQGKYPNYELNEVGALKRQILKAITELGWDFSIQVPKDSISLDEEINVIYKLKNTTDSVKRISIDSENPNFQTFILNPKGGQAEFVELKFPNGKNEIVSVLPDSTYQETWNLKDDAIYSGYLGTYKFKDPGIYRIRAYKRKTWISTEYLEIYLTNSP